ncbi:fibronectin type III domain-containing protein [Tenacibaculum ovolyticum]|uniref:fibronectin type III domain-containing protein n=1 Tax=Tenacibaculum ovolyticum TaxID=104270 RepID=UPI001F281DD4|nr:fibronectin type III domain-containing protein [Tenacibaculum ovolyticum]
MKKIFYLFIFILSISCSNNSEELTDPKDNGGDSVIITDNSSGSTTCHKPHNLEVQNPTTNSTTCTWGDNNNSQLFNIEYGIRGFTLGNGTRVSAGSRYKEITGLNNSTEYDFYVRANCGGDLYSEWQGPHSFVTN